MQERKLYASPELIVNEMFANGADVMSASESFKVNGYDGKDFDL